MFPLFLPLILALPLLPSSLATNNVEVGVKSGNATADGTCGAKSAEGVTCFGFAHGNCCSEYGWCGFSEAHCGSGCQHGFGDCFGEVASPSPYPTPSQPSPTQSSYAKPTSHTEPTPSYPVPVSSYHAVVSSLEPGHYTPFSSGYTYFTSSPRESTLSYSKPTAIHYSPSGYGYSPAPSSSTTPHSHPAPGYSKPIPSYSTPLSDYASASPSAYASASGTGYAPPHPTVYATHTITVTHGTVTETIYHAPSGQESGIALDLHLHRSHSVGRVGRCRGGWGDGCVDGGKVRQGTAP